jgi:hypothetical protein
MGCITWKRMAEYIAWSNEARYARLGDVCIEQIRGTQMGSTLSGVKASLEFGGSEADFIEGGYVAAGFAVAGRTIDECLQVVRYVDDSLMCSTTFCTRCMAEAGAQLYQAPIVFEVEEAGQSVGFLDMQVDVIGMALRVWRRNKNLEFMVGEARLPAKVRFAPNLGSDGPTRAEIQAWISQAWAADLQRTSPSFLPIGAGGAGGVEVRAARGCGTRAWRCSRSRWTLCMRCLEWDTRCERFKGAWPASGRNP